MAWAEKQRSGMYRAMYRDSTGKRCSAGTFRHKAEAIRKGAAAEDDARRRSWSNADAAKRTWGEWVEEWWPTRDVAESTKVTDRHRREKHLDPRWGKVQLGQITKQSVRSWLADLRAEGMSAATATRCVHLLSASLSAAVEADVLDFNPAAKVKPVADADEDKGRYLTDAEYEKLRAQMPTERDVLILEMLVRTGMRWGELAGLHMARVDLENAMIVVQETFDGKTYTMKGAPKNRRGRLVGLTPHLVDALRQISTRGTTCGYEHQSGKCPGPLAIVGQRGGALSQGWALRVFKPAVEAAGLGEVRIHDLRHTHASWLLQNGVALADIGHALGHRSSVTTQRYARLEEKPNPAISRVMESKASA